MKVLFFIVVFSFPFYMNAQTAHIDNGEVVYKGKINSSTVDLQAAKKFLENSTGSDPKEIKETDKAIVARASIRLNSPYHIIRKVHYSFSVKPESAGYSYRIDSVSVTEKERGGKTKTKSSKNIYKDMEESGLRSQNAEAILNEIDMRLQKVIALLKNQLSVSVQTR